MLFWHISHLSLELVIIELGSIDAGCSEDGVETMQSLVLHLIGAVALGLLTKVFDDIGNDVTDILRVTHDSLSVDILYSSILYPIFLAHRANIFQMEG